MLLKAIILLTAQHLLYTVRFISQDLTSSLLLTVTVCMDHSVYNDYGGVVFGLDEGQRIADALGTNKAVILQNHGLLTVGGTIEACAWWFMSLEKCCQVQLMAETAAGGINRDEARNINGLKLISKEAATQVSLST
eukprot:gene22767-28929_t